VKTELLDRLRCPKTGKRLVAVIDEGDSKVIEVGWLVSEDGQHRYPIKNSIPRFVHADNLPRGLVFSGINSAKRN